MQTAIQQLFNEFLSAKYGDTTGQIVPLYVTADLQWFSPTRFKTPLSVRMRNLSTEMWQ